MSMAKQRRGDTRVRTIKERVGRKTGIPPEQIQIKNPGGGTARGDKKISNLRPKKKAK